MSWKVAGKRWERGKERKGGGKKEGRIDGWMEGQEKIGRGQEKNGKRG